MSLKLTKLVYGTEIDPKKTPFGLVNNQIRADSIINNAGWFNSNGERLGRGDLSLQDMSKISKAIGDDMFLVLSEADCSWNMPRDIEETSPGFNYVITNISWGITSGSIIRVRDFIDRPEKMSRDGVEYTRINRRSFIESLSNIITAQKNTAVQPKKPVIKEYAYLTNASP